MAVDGAAELLDVLVGMTGEADLHERLHLQAQAVGIDDGGVALNDAGLLHELDAPGAGRTRKADLLGQLDDGAPAVALQLIENGGVVAVQVHSARLLRGIA